MQGFDLERATDHGKVAGVCAGVADRWHVDPLVVRIAAVLLALCAGVGAVLYGAAWALLPTKGEEHGPLQKSVPATRQVPLPAWIAATAVVAVVVMTITGPVLPISSTPVVVLAAVWYFGFFRPAQKRRRSQAPDPTPDVPQPQTGPEPVGFVAAPATEQPQWQAYPGTAAPTPPPTPQTGPNPTHRARPTASARARRLRATGILVAALAVVALAVLNVADVVHPPFAAFTAVALLAIGVTIALTAWTGRPRGLLPLGVVLLSATLLGSLATQSGDSTSAAEAVPTRSYSALADLPASDQVDAGQLHVDLSNLTVDEDRSYTVRVDVGSVVVVLPRDANVVVDAGTDTGVVTVDGVTRSGIDLNMRREFISRPGEPVLQIRIRVDAGTIEVRPS